MKKAKHLVVITKCTKYLILHRQSKRKALIENLKQENCIKSFFFVKYNHEWTFKLSQTANKNSVYSSLKIYDNS